VATKTGEGTESIVPVAEDPKIPVNEFLAGIPGQEEMKSAFTKLVQPEQNSIVRWQVLWGKFKTKPMDVAWAEWVGEV